MAEYTAQEITSFVHAGRGAESLHGGGELSHSMSTEHNELVGAMKALQRDMAPHWQGKAADAAYAGANPLIAASEVSGEHLSKAQRLYDGQGESFERLKGDVGSGVSAPPQSTWLSDSPLQFLTGRDEEIEQYNAKAQRIVDAYNRYSGDSSTNAAQWPDDYGQLGMPPGGADFMVAMPGAGTGGGGGGSASAPTFSGSYTAPGSTSVASGGLGSVGSYGAGVAGVGGYAGGGDSGGYAGGTSAPSPGAGWYVQAPAASDGTTSTSGYADASPMPGHGSGASGPYGAAPAYGAGYAAGQGGAYAPGGGYGPGGRSAPGSASSGGSSRSGTSGFGTRGSAGGGSGAYGARGASGFGPTGSGDGPGSPQGTGRSSGVGPAPKEATGPVRGASAAAGAAGNTPHGRAPMGMAGAGRGQGEEDETHDRPTYLEENDVDSIFGPDPDDKTVPPVIGL